MRARGLSCGMQSRRDVVTTQGLGGWRALAASKVVLRCCLNSRSVHQHLGHGPLSCRQRRLQACFGRCMRARGLSCGMQSRCDVVTTQGLGGWRAMAASKVVLRCCLNSRSVHQHLGHGPLSCRQRRLQACFGRCMRARGLSCGMQSRCDVVTTQGLGGWRAMAASKVVLRCCLYSRSIHQHLGHGPLSCRQRRFAGLL